MLAGAKGQAKKALDEATARATAIHDGAERRLSLLSTRHAETIKRLTDILDGVSSLVTAEAARLSLEDEVEQNTAKTIAAHATGDSARPAPAGANRAVRFRRVWLGFCGFCGFCGFWGFWASGGAAGATTPRTATQPLASTGPARPAPASAPQSPAPQAEDKRSPVRAVVIDSDEKPTNGVRVMPGSDN